jgi:hypothetical protein
MKGLLAGDPGREKLMTQLTDLPVEALGTLRQIELAGCSNEEKVDLGKMIRSLQRLVSRIGQLVTRRALMPARAQELLQPCFACLEVEFQQVLDAFAECFRRGDCRQEFPTVRGALRNMDHAVQEIRDHNLFGQLLPEASLRFLDIIDLYHAIVEALEETGRLIGSLRIERYWGDYRL